ncbi:MAG: AmmeMemoRadiSam system protein B, partial [Acidobacteria bacterium]
PVVAGKFYPMHDVELGRLVGTLYQAVDVSPRPAFGVLAPHAGYVYSGACAARALADVDIPPQVVLLGPNHTGHGARLSAAPEDLWRTPLGNVPVDAELLGELEAACPGLRREPAAHRFEHSLEVEVPFLQVRRPDVTIAPIVVGTHDLDELLGLGRALAEVCEARTPRPLLLVSSDMTHYEPATRAAEKDRLALERLEAVDPEGLHRVVLSRGISMCGVAPAVAALEALRRMGARRGEVVCYTNSGAVTGDDREVVAYAGVVFR